MPKRVVVIVAIAAIIVSGLILLSARQPTSPPQPATAPAVSSITQRPTSAVPVSSSTVLVSTTAQSSSSSGKPLLTPPGWTTFVSEKFGFQISYPNEPDKFLLWHDCGTEATLPLEASGRCAINFFTVRNPGENQEDITIVVTVYQKDPAMLLAKWISSGLPALQGVPKGDVFQALAEAYGSEQGASAPGKILTHTENDQKDMSQYEVGAVVGGGGTLSYTTLIARNQSKYVYSVELLMQFNDAAGSPTASDRQYVELYKRILSTLVISS